MKMFFTILMLCFTFESVAQSHIMGEIRSNDDKPLSFANVLLLKTKDSSLVKGSIATENGFYQFENIKEGTYFISASMIGYEKVSSAHFQIAASEKELRMTLLIAKELTAQLKEVAVRAKKPLYEQQTDRLVVNVESSITASGGTALEVLERSPGMSVNRQTNVLSMSGKSGVMVLINGKLTRLPMEAVIQLLEGMTANTIEKIELITTPPARYDAEGDAGLINIITRKNLNYGTNVSLSATMGYGWYERPAGSVNLNHRRQKLNLYGDYSYIRNRHWVQYSTFRSVTQPDGLLETNLVANRYQKSPVHTSKIGFDYNLKPNTIFSGLISGFHNTNRQHIPSVSHVYLNNKMITENKVGINEANVWENAMVNLSMKHNFRNKLEWSIDADRLYYRNVDPTYYLAESTDLRSNNLAQQEFRVNKDTPIKLWVIKTDFARPFLKNKWETGAKLTSTNLMNEVLMEIHEDNQWLTESTFSQQYKLTERIGAVYSNFTTQLFKKVTLQIGARYEHTQTDINTLARQSLVKRNYGNFFPNVSVSDKISKDHTLNFSYGRRITRPSYKDLAPWVIFADLNTFFYGNENLLPTISEVLQSSYVLKEKYIFSLRYSYDKNAIATYLPHIDAANNRVNFFPENIDRQQTLTFTTSIPVTFTKWWQTQNSFTGYWQKIKTVFQNAPFNRTIWNAQFNTSHSFRLPHAMMGEMLFFYRSPSLNGIARVAATAELSFGLQKTLSKNAGTLRLNINDVFWTNRGRSSSRIEAINLNVRSTFLREPRTTRLTYSRSFGNQKVKASQKRMTGSEEERQRL
ncbi:TonB-dependent receptor domain-containing protein [Emticicia sp. BO119]|uniref:TonB-dependent receptor domain-containing protein n=1 Tax=Emticicia sp. BO119 TaxID=2757768 RepID=UPI0015F0FF97|nr:TonB-dependent receptor [Emticicia sp. BO119]MBA4850501.1 TonB-dependent receptor [Emticicia sp. BO119]